MLQEITNEHLKNLDLDALASNQDFGRLNFKESLENLQRIRALFVELDDLGYKAELTGSEIDLIDNRKRRFVTKLNELRSFNIGESDSQNKHDSLVNEFHHLRNDVEKELRPQLVYLRQQSADQSSDTQELQRLQKEAAKNKREYEELKKQLKEQLTEIDNRQKDIASKKGEVAAQIFGRHFEVSAKEYSDSAAKWLMAGIVSFALLASIVLINFCVYIYFCMKDWDSGTFFTLEYALVKFTLLLLLSYVIGFTSRQYSINQHLAAINIHRKNIAETMKDFYGSDLEMSAKTHVIAYGTEAMFKNQPVGHISKSEARDHEGPIHQVISQIPSPKV